MALPRQVHGGGAPRPRGGWTSCFKGDREVHVRSAGHRILTARTHHQLLGLKGTVSTDRQTRRGARSNQMSV